MGCITRERLIELGPKAIKTYIEWDLRKLGRSNEKADGGIEQWDKLQKLLPKKGSRKRVVDKAELFKALSEGMLAANYTKKERRYIQKMCANGADLELAIRECSKGATVLKEILNDSAIPR